MKSDTYTKAVLTAIAICLFVIAIKDTELIRKAYAGVFAQEIAYCFSGAYTEKVNESKWIINLNCKLSW